MLKKKVFLEITGIVFLIFFTVLLTLFILNKKTKTISNTLENSKQSALIVSNKQKIKVSDFVLKERDANIIKNQPFFLRTKHSRWSEREIKKYWKDQNKVLGKILENENEKRIEALLKE